MHRTPLLDLLARYLERHPDERARAQPLRRFVETHDDCFERSCLVGHVTGSAWILSPDHASVLLTHHRKLGRWLQLGGHADGEPDPLRVALREAREESGMQELRVLAAEEPPIPFDLDVHEIPARAGEPAHLHHDVRYLLVAAPGQRLMLSEESHALRWVERARLGELELDESLLRMERKTRALLAEHGPRGARSE